MQGQSDTCTIDSFGECRTTTTTQPTSGHSINPTTYTNSPSIIPTKYPTLQPSANVSPSPSIAPLPPIYLTSHMLNTTNNATSTTKFLPILDSGTPSTFLCIQSTITLCTVIIAICCACFMITCIISVCCCTRKPKNDKVIKNDSNDIINNLPDLPSSMKGTISAEGMQKIRNVNLPGEFGDELQSGIINNSEIKMFDIEYAGKQPSIQPVNHHIRIPSDTQFTATATNDRRSQIKLHVSMNTDTTDLTELKLQTIKSEETNNSNISDLFEEYIEDGNEENERIRASIGLVLHSRAVSRNSEQDIVTPGNSDLGDIVMNVYDQEPGHDSLIKEIEDMIMDESSSSSARIDIPSVGTKRALL